MADLSRYARLSRGPSRIMPPILAGTSGVWTNVTPGSITMASNFVGATFTVVADPLQLSDLYVVSYTLGVYKSVDYGATWKGPINTGAGGSSAVALQISIAPGLPGTPVLYGGGIISPSVGFWRSLDRGASWTNYTHTGARQDCYQPAVNPYNANHLLIVGHEQDYLGESMDGGQTWATRSLNAGMLPGTGTNFCFFINTGTPSTTGTTWLWIAQGASGAYGTWRTTNSGTSWTQVDTNEHPHGNCQIYQPDTSGVLYMAGIYSGLGQGVLRSTDYGATWANVTGNTNPEAIVWGTSTTVYGANGGAADLGGSNPPLLVSAPQPGTSWSAMSPQNPSGMDLGPGSAAVVTDGVRTAFVLGCWSSGIWRYIE